MKNIWLLALLLSAHSLAVAAPPLVDYRWLGQNMGSDKLLVVDLRAKNAYEYAHIRGSVHSDFNLWRQPNAQKVESMLPSKQHLEKLMSQLGARPDSHIVLVTGDTAGELASAARVYWTLDQIGHAKKSILDGGIMAYARARLPLERGAANPKPSDYKIFRLRQDRISAEDIQSSHKKLNLVDVRSRAEFLGIHQGAPDERAGTLPGAVNLPYDWFTQNGAGSITGSDNLNTVLQMVELDESKPTVVFCHTGNRASLSWFVLHELMGRKNTVLYDGSTREWAKRRDLPIHQAIDINHKVAM